MDFLSSLLLGALEGITEFLPISSTAHLLLGEQILGLPETVFLKSFTIAIQLGAILAVVVIYFERLLRDWAVNFRVAAAFIPTAVIGLLVYKFFKEKLLSSHVVVLVALGIGGLALIIFELLIKNKKDEAQSDLAKLPFWKAGLIGVIQAISIVPGVSRAAATIVGGMALGLSRKAVVEFSFLLAVPTMIAATGYDLYKSAGQFSADNWPVLAVGFVTAFLFAWLSVRFLLKFIQNNTFVLFGVYRIALVLLFLLLAGY
jgi:undecaprenyl-diphosphatase